MCVCGGGGAETHCHVQFLDVICCIVQNVHASNEGTLGAPTCFSLVPISIFTFLIVPVSQFLNYIYFLNLIFFMFFENNIFC
jgi:hypothetical protein